MIVDPSALIAILRGEDGCDELAEKLSLMIGQIKLSSAGYLEMAIVGDNPKYAIAHVAVDRLITDLQIEVVAVTPAQARIARDAHTRFGRWSRSPAKLNFGDCFSYALAIDRDEPLLFKGDDFGWTDVRVG